jgi:hypothetical protein
MTGELARKPEQYAFAADISLNLQSRGEIDFHDLIFAYTRDMCFNNMLMNCIF